MSVIVKPPIVSATRDKLDFLLTLTYMANYDAKFACEQ